MLLGPSVPGTGTPPISEYSLGLGSLLVSVCPGTVSSTSRLRKTYLLTYLLVQTGEFWFRYSLLGSSHSVPDYLEEAQGTMIYGSTKDGRGETGVSPTRSLEGSDLQDEGRRIDGPKSVE